MLLTKEPNQLIKFSFLFVVFCNAVVDISHKILLQNIVFKIFDGSEQVIWISVINALIILPFLLLFSTSGYLSDRYNKKDILVYGALSSLTLSVLMVAAYATGSFETAMFVLVLLAVQSAIYSPAKFGIIIEIYGKENLSAGNSALQGITIIAMLFAMAMTSYIFESFFTLHSLETYTTKEGLLGAILPLTYYVIPVALLEFLISFLILKKIKTTTTTTPTTFSKKALLKGELLSKNIQAIVSNSVILLSVIGLATFWAVSQGLVVVFPSFAKAYLEITNTFVINGIIASSGVGIAVGSLLYAKLSKHYIEVGTIPIAALGMALTIYLAISVESVYLLGFAFFAFGMFGGLFIVPLNALIQFNAKQTKLGTILAGNNWFQSLFMFSMLLMTTIFALNHVDTLTIIYIILSITLIGSIYTIYKLPQSMVLLFLKFIVGLRYKLDVHGIKNIPSNGGVLLLGNHISWIDWAIVLMSTPREVKFVMDRGIYNRWYINWLLKIFKAIPISGLSSKSALQAVAKNLDEGHVVVLFPEGSITRNGHLGEFKKGFEKILALTETEVKVTPFYIKGLWESMFSRATDKYKKNNRTSHVTISFGTPLTKQDANTVTVKKAVVTLSSLSWKQHIATRRTLSETIFDRLKSVSNELIFADSTGMELSGNKFLTLSILFKQLLSKKISGQNIGLLLPSTAT
nr:MFS transporter [Campylobacterota bacterium]